VTDPLLTVPEVAERLRISQRTLRRLVAGGHLRPVRIGSRTLFTDREVAAFVAASQRRRVA
jgi:excisionase family DNA binding protein